MIPVTLKGIPENNRTLTLDVLSLPSDTTALSTTERSTVKNWKRTSEKKPIVTAKKGTLQKYMGPSNFPKQLKRHLPAPEKTSQLIKIQRTTTTEKKDDIKSSELVDREKQSPGEVTTTDNLNDVDFEDVDIVNKNVTKKKSAKKSTQYKWRKILRKKSSKSKGSRKSSIFDNDRTLQALLARVEQSDLKSTTREHKPADAKETDVSTVATKQTDEQTTKPTDDIVTDQRRVESLDHSTKPFNVEKTKEVIRKKSSLQRNRLIDEVEIPIAVVAQKKSSVIKNDHSDWKSIEEGGSTPRDLHFDASSTSLRASQHMKSSRHGKSSKIQKPKQATLSNFLVSHQTANRRSSRTLKRSKSTSTKKKTEKSDLLLLRGQNPFYKGKSESASSSSE